MTGHNFNKAFLFLTKRADSISLIKDTLSFTFCKDFYNVKYHI